jgi:hypothetical protein
MPVAASQSRRHSDMLTTSKVLAGLIRDYIGSVAQGGREFRVVIPGLTAKVGAEVHELLRAANLNSYLAISSERTPDKSLRWLDPISLTNIRIGSFVAITDPGAMAEVRDSVRGTGGAIRSVGFSEEWPWIDDGSESFRFRAPFAPALVALWTTVKDEQAWLRSFLIDGLVPATRRIPERAPLLLDVILGGFDSSANLSSGNTCERFLRHCGVPKPVAIASDAKGLVKDTRLLIRGILERARKESDLRGSIKAKITDTEPKAAELRQALDSFFDGLAAYSALDGDLLALRHCWGQPEISERNWSLLTAARLRELFEIVEVTPITLQCGWVPGSGILVADDGIVAACDSDSAIELAVTYEIPSADLQASACRLVVSVRQTQLAVIELTANIGEETITVALGDHEIPHRTRVPVTVTIFTGSDARGQFRLYLHCCGAQRPAFAVAKPGFWVANAEDVSNDPSPAQRQSVDGPVTLYFFSVDSVQPKVTIDEDQERQVRKHPESAIWVTAESINALDASGGQINCTCHMGSRWLSLTLAAEDIVRGEFTLEDELRGAVVANKSDATKDMLAIFEGRSDEPYHRLGSINKQSLRRARLARCFEDRSGWQPLFGDLLATGEGTVQACGDFARTIGSGADTQLLAKAKLPDAALALVARYAERRDAFRLAVLATLRAPSSAEEHPHYAIYPFYLADDASGRAALELALADYLQAYCDIREFLRSSLESLSWEQVSLLTYLDCVVNWKADNSKGSFFLLGPWHPLMAAKRFMVQHALVLRARRLISGIKQASLSHLAGLLGDIGGFSWFAVPKADDRSFEAAYVVPTSDPGWHFAFKREAAEVTHDGSNERVLVDAANAVRMTLGLEARVRLPSTTAMVRAVLNSYIRTFPSRRHLGVHLSAGFSGEEELKEFDQFLHAEGKPTLAGAQLPGGIHASFEVRPIVPDDVQWSDPSLKVFVHPEREQCVEEQHPNVLFSGSGDDVKFLEGRDQTALPRGMGNGSVFSQPLSQIVHGQTGISQSVTLEWDALSESKAQGVGPLFAHACALNCALSGTARGIVRPANLPASLDAAWTIVPGTVLDPAVFVRYVRDGRSRSIEDRALWDYRISIARTSTSYFVLSAIPAAFRNALNGKFPGATDLAIECITELGQLGLAIGGEAMKSGRHALGTLGVVAAVRLFHSGGGLQGAFEWTKQRTGFLIPVDSFLDLLERPAKGGTDELAESDRRRGDLIAMAVTLPAAGARKLRLEAIVVECKFTNGALDTPYASGALEQSRRSMERLIALCKAAQAEDGMPERLALLQLVRFGLRISGGHESSSVQHLQQESIVYRHILRGELELVPAKADALLVSTELSLPGSAEVSKHGNGLWIRLNRQHWPGVAETPAISAARSAVSNLFAIGPSTDGTKNPLITSPQPPVAPPVVTPVPAIQPANPALSPEAVASVQPVSTPTASAAPVDAPGVVLAKVLVGMDSSRRSVYFDPHSPVDRLDNVNTMVTGSSGKGKTQLVKYLVAAVREQGANAILLDFKNDFVSDPHFVATAKLDATLVAFDGMPFNPLIPFPMTDPRTGKKFIQCAQHITGIAAVFRRTYALGAQQEAAVKNAIRQAFTTAGVDPTGIVPYNSETTFPDLAAVGEILEETNLSAYNRLDPLFTLGLFREQFWRISFASMVNRSVALDFSQLPSDELKNSLAELVVLSAHSYFNSQPHCGRLKQLFVVDEAHRILKADFLERFALECRAYGVGLLLSSQYPSHFPADISACMATKVIHGNDRDVDRVRDIVNLLGCPGHESSIADLGMFEAIFSNKHFRNVGIRTLTYPLYLVFKAIEQGAALTLEQIANVPGIDPQKLPPGNIVFHLERLGLCETVDGKVRTVRQEP